MGRAGLRPPACVSTLTSQVAAGNSMLARFRPGSSSLRANHGWTRCMLRTVMQGGGGSGK